MIRKLCEKQNISLAELCRRIDKVEFDGQIGFIFGRRNSGYFDIRKLNREVIHRSASWKKLKLLETRRSLLTERGMQGVGIAEYFMKKRKGWLGHL